MILVNGLPYQESKIADFVKSHLTKTLLLKFSANEMQVLQSVFSYISLSNSHGKKHSEVAYATIAEKLDLHPRTVRRICKRFMTINVLKDLNTKKKQNFILKKNSVCHFVLTAEFHILYLKSLRCEQKELVKKCKEGQIAPQAFDHKLKIKNRSISNIRPPQPDSPVDNLPLPKAALVDKVKPKTKTSTISGLYSKPQYKTDTDFEASILQASTLRKETEVSAKTGTPISMLRFVFGNWYLERNIQRNNWDYLYLKHLAREKPIYTDKKNEPIPRDDRPSAKFFSERKVEKRQPNVSPLLQGVMLQQPQKYEKALGVIEITTPVQKSTLSYAQDRKSSQILNFLPNCIMEGLKNDKEIF